MHGQSEHTKVPRITATLIQAAAVWVGVWLLAHDGSLGARDFAVLACSGIYLARSAFGMFVLLQRRFGWGETAAVGTVFAMIHIGFASLGASHSQSLDSLAFIGLGMYIVGSYFNTASEYGRLLWKRNTGNAGQLYRGGVVSPLDAHQLFW